LDAAAAFFAFGFGGGGLFSTCRFISVNFSEQTDCASGGGYPSP